jgi:uncharacterized membrane protein HdeD (DUF308 family)
LQDSAAEDALMSRRLIGVILIVIGVVALAWGGVFWTDRDTVVDAGPLQVETEETEGFALPPILGIISLVGGIILVAVPSRTRT